MYYHIPTTTGKWVKLQLPNPPVNEKQREIQKALMNAPMNEWEAIIERLTNPTGSL